MNVINTELLKEKEHTVLDFLYYWNRPIRVGDLVKQLNIKHSTLNSVLHRLTEQKLVNWETYGLVTLTATGTETAAHLSNHHFIIEKFLKESLELNAEEAHEEAIHLAGAVSCRLIDAMCKKLQISHEENTTNYCSQRNYLEENKNSEKIKHS